MSIHLHNSRANIAMTVRASLHTGSGIMCNKIPVAQILALDFTPSKRKRRMYTLIDCTNYRVIATHPNHRALTALAYIQYANVDTTVMPCNENRPFAQFTAEQLDRLAESATAKETTAFKTGEYTYGDIVARTRLIIEAAPNLRLPFKPEQMEEQADKIKEDDDRPWSIDAAGIAKPAKRWIVDPQRNRPRYGAKPEAEQFKPQASGPAGRPPKEEKPEHVMTRKAKGLSYEDFIGEGWTDELLIEHGYMKR